VGYGRRRTERRYRNTEAGFVLDPEYVGESVAQRIERDLGGEVLTHSQRLGPMCRASALLAEVIAAGELEYPDDADLTKQADAKLERRRREMSEPEPEPMTPATRRFLDDGDGAEW